GALSCAGCREQRAGAAGEHRIDPARARCGTAGESRGSADWRYDGAEAEACRGCGGDGRLLRGRSHAGPHDDGLVEQAARAEASLRDYVRRRPGHYGSRQPRSVGAGGKTIGLNIKLPFEQMPNPYITPALNFNFHYFFMRKYWFAYLAKALVVFPGGFGTLDEMFELLTLAQTHKLAKKMTIVIYGSKYWKNVINLDLLAEKG